jgi:hypothetical protein
MDKITFDEAESRCGRKQTVLSEFCQVILESKKLICTPDIRTLMATVVAGR